MHRKYRAARSATSLNAVMATGEMVLHCKNAHVPYDLFVVARIEFLEWTRTVDYAMRSSPDFAAARMLAR